VSSLFTDTAPLFRSVAVLILMMTVAPTQVAMSVPVDAIAVLVPIRPVIDDAPGQGDESYECAPERHPVQMSHVQIPLTVMTDDGRPSPHPHKHQARTVPQGGASNGAPDAP
jgi:hypothetical protein